MFRPWWAWPGTPLIDLHQPNGASLSRCACAAPGLNVPHALFPPQVLKQRQFNPMPIEQQTVVVYSATKGFLDKVRAVIQMLVDRRSESEFRV